MTKLKTIILDIETSPIIAKVWGMKDQNIAPNQIVKDWQVIAWSVKELNAPKNTIVYKDLRKTPQGTDLHLVNQLGTLLDKVDIVISYNGKRFDIPKINTRMIIHRLYAKPKFKHFDVWELVARAAAFTSTKAEYVWSLINKKYQKLKHEKFPGMELWNECEKGTLKAWEEMRLYNIQDTLATEESALILKDWAPKSFPDWEAEKCESCGKIKKLKVKCMDCNSWSMK